MNDFQTRAPSTRDADRALRARPSTTRIKIPLIPYHPTRVHHPRAHPTRVRSSPARSIRDPRPATFILPTRRTHPTSKTNKTYRDEAHRFATRGVFVFTRRAHRDARALSASRARGDDGRRDDGRRENAGHHHHREGGKCRAEGTSSAARGFTRGEGGSSTTHDPSIEVSPSHPRVIFFW